MSAALAARLGDEIGSHGHGWLGLIGGALAGIVMGALIVGATLAVGAALIASGGTLAIVAGALIASGGLALGAGTATGLASIGAKIGKKHISGARCSEVGKDCSPDTEIEGRPAARATLDLGTHGNVIIAQGSSRVYVNKAPLAREGDGVKCGGKIVKACERTWIGGDPTDDNVSDGPSDALLHKLDTASSWLMGIGAGLLIAGTTLAGGVLGGVWGAVTAGGKALLSGAAWTVGSSIGHSVTEHFFGEGAGLWFDAAMMMSGPLMGAREGMRGLRGLYEGNLLPKGLPARTPGAPHTDAAVVGEGPVGLATAIKIKSTSPDAQVTLFERRALSRAPRPNTPTYFPETLETFKSIGLDASDKNFTFIEDRIEVATDGATEHEPIERPVIKGNHKPYTTTDMLADGAHGVATTSIGNTEAQLRTIAENMGIDIRYESEVTGARNVNDGVELTVKGKNGEPETVHSSYAVIADGASGVGQQMSQPNIRGNVPMMASATTVVGDKTFTHAKYPDPSAPGGYIVLTKIGSESGVSVLAEVPPRLENASAEEKQAWFQGIAEQMGIPASSFKTKPMAFPAKLSEGKIGHGRLFVIGDAAGTVPIISGSGVNKGVRQGVDTGNIIGQALNHPTLVRPIEPELLAIHATREQRAQTQLVDGIQGYVGDHLRAWPPPEPPECPTCNGVAPAPALPSPTEAIAKGSADPAGVWDLPKPAVEAPSPPPANEPAPRPLVVNLGGEGEPVAGVPANAQVIELNRLDEGATRRPIPKIIKDAGGRLVQGDMTKMPFGDGQVDRLIGNDVPSPLTGALPQEAFRVLKPGGTIKIVSRSGGGQVWVEPLQKAGFDVKMEGGYAVGTKPDVEVVPPAPDIAVPEESAPSKLPPQDVRTMKGLGPDDDVQMFLRYKNGDAQTLRVPSKDVPALLDDAKVTEARLMGAKSTSDAPWPDTYVDGARSAQSYFDRSPNAVRDVTVTYKSTLEGHARVNRDGMVDLLNDPNVDSVAFDDAYKSWELPDTDAIPPEQRGADYAAEVQRIAAEKRAAEEAAQAEKEQGYRDAYDAPSVDRKDAPAGLLGADKHWPSVQEQLDNDGTVTLYRGMRVPRGHAVLDGGGVDTNSSFGGQYATADPRQALSYGARPEGDHPGGFQADDDAVLVSFKAKKEDVELTSDSRVAILKPGRPLTQQPGFQEVARVPADEVFDILPPKPGANLSPAPPPKLNPTPPPAGGEPACPTCEL